ncbi:MAG TPA: helix-hairpin-helix domain-containing protein [Chitinophagaceae bacterium]|nr:helix-hairpin-helix domain-containing protein [Chitinophagaceae bacterium]
MIRSVTIVFLLTEFVMHALDGWGQNLPPSTEQQLENQTDVDQIETEDDALLQQLEHFKKHPVNLNQATANDLNELAFLSELQIDNMVSYRSLLGRFISIYELQAIPGWDIGTIKKILPYISISNATAATDELQTKFNNGDHQLLVRYSQTVERSQGFEKQSTAQRYLGSRERFFFRYHYQYKNVLQYGIVGDKDAGEQFFSGRQKYGFDFYSLHFFARKTGRIESFALGDFTVNMGQGLIQWQALAFKKSGDATAIKRQSSILRPYNSAGEFYFHRGAGVTLKFKTIGITGYVSLRQLSANLLVDTIHNAKFISSFLTSGYHRTQSENDDRNNMRQLSFGGNVVYRARNWHIGINGVRYNFSLPIQKRNEPYNLFAVSGRSWGNLSIDYSWTYHNVHAFGEAAIDKNFDRAFLNGLLISVDPRVDLSILHRAIGKAYQAMYGNAFTENSYPTNENGLYTGVSIRPASGWGLDMYVDIYKFPWLKYLVDAPSYGKDLLIQLNYTPNKQVQISSRYRSETKQSGQRANSAVNQLVLIPRRGWRTQLNYRVTQAITLRNRIELVWYDNKRADAEEGFLTFFDVLYTPGLKPFSANIRLAYFDTDDYNSRIYAYENDVLFSYSIPAFFDKGYRYYINFGYDLSKSISFWMHWTQIIFSNRKQIAGGSDEINSNHRSEIRLQGQWIF